MPRPKATTFNIQPDWTQSWTMSQAEEQLDGFKFNGPGWYITKNESMLVVPKDEPIRLEHGNFPLWHQAWPPYTVFLFMIYSSNDPGLSIMALNRAPTRLDERE